MAYAALDHFLSQMTIPADRTAPAEGATLHDHIFARQTTAHVNSGPRFVGSWISGLRPDHLEPRHRGGGRAQQAEGHPAPRHARPAMPGRRRFGHHVLAIGCNDTGPMAISIYDPNAPDRMAFSPNAPITIFTTPWRQASRTTRCSSMMDTHGRPRPCSPVSRIGAGAAMPGVVLLRESHQRRLRDGRLARRGWQRQLRAVAQRGERSAELEMVFQVRGSLLRRPSGQRRHLPDRRHSQWPQQRQLYPGAGRGHGPAELALVPMCEGLFFSGNNTLGVCPAIRMGMTGREAATISANDQRLTRAAFLPDAARGRTR